MDSTTIMVALGVIVAIVGGYFVARQSNEFEAVRGGGIAQAAHYVVCAAMAGLPAAFWFTVAVFIFTATGFREAFEPFVLYAVINLVVILTALVVYGAVEPDKAPAQGVEMPPLD